MEVYLYVSLDGNQVYLRTYRHVGFVRPIYRAIQMTLSGGTVCCLRNVLEESLPFCPEE